MLIRIQSDELGGQEWALIELQGKIESQEDIGLEGASLPVGTIQLSNTNEAVVQLQIGYHVLEGKRMPLKKPVAVLEKQLQQDNSTGSSQVVCKVIGVLRHKYLFKTRPRALISKPGARPKH